MHLYQGSTHQFIADATQARLANQLSDRFFDEFRYRPAPSEVTSWRNSLGAMASVLQLADLTDQGILVELKLPLSSNRLGVPLLPVLTSFGFSFLRAMGRQVVRPELARDGRTMGVEVADRRAGRTSDSPR